MDAQTSVFETIDTLGYPILILKYADERYDFVYANSTLKSLASITEEQPISEPIQSLIRHIPKKTDGTSNALHNFEIFGSLYTIYFNRNGDHLFVIFIELQFQELFKSITFDAHDIDYKPIIVILDTDGALVDANESFLNIVNKQREDVLHQSFFDRFIPGNREKLNGYLQALCSDDIPHQHFITPLKGSNDKLYRIQWQVSTMKKAEQTYIVAIGNDISKYVEENCELKRELTSIKVGFDFFPMAVGYMDAKGIFITMNPKFIKLLKIPKEKKHLHFKEIPLLKKHIDLRQMNEYIELIKEMHYNFEENGEKYRVDVRALQSPKKKIKLYIFVIQKN
ncbi:PAS domain-containing protein [Sulfurimonas sp. HSL-1716]|uniref:PAS domain-containing protein n=1 Tax=Hydrocurvibacter sulfurireducens TaxID=3131937 RepID=UPI0031F79723